jgi:hypothetical protein
MEEDEVQGDNIPEDAILISDEEFIEGEGADTMEEAIANRKEAYLDYLDRQRI